MSSLVLKIRKVREVPDPEYQTSGSAAFDLHAAILDEVELQPGERRVIPTGLTMAIPEGYEGQVRPRSGLAIKKGFGMVNSPGTIDSDFRGEIGIIAINFGAEPITIKPLERVAQMLIAPVTRVRFEMVDELDVTERGIGGYGSTGG